MATTLANISIKDSSSWNTYLNLIYPVGSIYQSTNSTSPASIVGGTWSAIQGRFLLGQSSSYAVNSQKGAATVTLTTNQMPSHGHTFQMNGTIVGWTGESPGWVCTWDAPNSWGNGYPNGTYDAYTNLEQGTRIIGLTGGGLLTRICHPITWSISGEGLLSSLLGGGVDD